MSLVLDASVAIAGFHTREQTPSLLALLDDIFRNGCFVPPIWKIEVANVLRTKVRAKEYDLAQRDAILRDIGTLPVLVDATSLDATWTSAVKLSDQHDLSVYDATYLEIAVRRGLPLATFDKKLRSAATAAGVPLAHL